jgi:5'-nucleotidase
MRSCASLIFLTGCLATSSAHRLPAPVTRLRIIGTNDFHGALDPRRDARGVLRGGAAALAATIQRAEAECVAPSCQWILLDGGDEFQGTPASNLAYGRPVSDIFNALGYAAAALGNHEFDWGQDTLRARMRQEHYAVLGANVRYTDGRDVPWIRDDTLVTRGPFRIGIIGITTQSTTTAAKASMIAGLRFDNPAPIVDSLATLLRQRGANKIIVVAHAGGTCDANGRSGCSGEIFTTMRQVTQPIDAVLSGHSHTFINVLVGDTPITQARSSGSAIDVIDLPLGPATGPLLHEVRDVLTDAIPPNGLIAGQVAAADAAVADQVKRPIATVSEDMLRTGEDYALGNLIADAMRAAGNADFGAMNHGGVRADLHQGVATYGALFEVQPFANVLFKVTASGKAMRRYLEQLVGGSRPNIWLSGGTVTVDSTRPAGSRITGIVLASGRPFDDASTYTIVVNDFMVTNNGTLAFPGTPIASEALNVTDLDALIAYLERLPQPVVAPKDIRIRIGPE